MFKTGARLLVLTTEDLAESRITVGDVVLMAGINRNPEYIDIQLLSGEQILGLYPWRFRETTNRIDE